MPGRNVDGEIIVGINQPESLKVMDEDLKKILSQIKDLEARISHAKLDKTAEEELRKQISDIKATINVPNIKIDQSQAVKNAQQTGQNIGSAINQGVSSSLKSIKNDIANTIKSIPRLDASEIIKAMNLDRASVGNDVASQVRLLVSEINNLGKEVAKAGSDGSWEKLISKGTELGKVLDTFGKARNYPAIEEVKKFADYFHGKTISVGYKSSGLSGTDFTVSQLNKDLKELGVKFSATKQNAIELDGVWEEMCNTTGRMDLLNITTAQDQLRTIISELQQANSLMNGEKGLVDFPNARSVVSEYFGCVEKARKVVANLGTEISTLAQNESRNSTASADTVARNEQKKQQAYKQTADAQKQAAQEIRDATGDYEKAIKDVTSPSIGKYFKVDASTSAQFKAEMEKLVSEWTDAKGKLTDIKIETRTSFDPKAGENIERLHQAVVTYKNGLDEVIKKTIAWRQIGTTTNDKGEEVALRGFVEVAGQYSKALDTATAKTDTFAKKQKETVANMQNTINQITSRAFDSNSSRPITSDSSLEKLNVQVTNVENAMAELRNATSATFDDAKIKVQDEISQLKILEKELRNADNVSTKMKGTDFSSGFDIAKNDLEKFKADAKDFPQITQTIEDLDKAIASVGDASSLNKFNDDLRVARSELAKIKSEASATNRNEKVGIKVSSLKSSIADLQRISPEIDKFKTEINGADVTVQSLSDDLSKVSTQSDFSVVNAKWKAFTDAAKAAGIAVTDVGSNVKSMQEQAEKSTNSFFASLKNLSFLKYWTSTNYIFMTAIRNIKKMISNVRELDDAMTNISYTMDVSNAQLMKIGSSALQMAKDLNTSASNVLGAVKLYSNAKESAESILQKAKPAIMLSNVTGFSGEESAKYLQTIMNQFDMTQDDLMDISDTIQVISQNIAHDFADGIVQINEGISTSGEVARAAGMDLADYASMIGLLVEKTGLAGSQLGNSLKTIMTRTTKAGKIMGIDEGEISDAEESLRSIGIEVRKTDGEFKDFNVTMKELSKQWDSLSDVEKSNISFNLAGTRQINVIQTLLRNWSDYEDLVNKANDSTGVTLQNQEIYAESLAGKMGELSAIWEKIGDDAISSNFLKGLADAGIGVSSLIEKIGLLKTTIASVSIAAFVKNFACP